MMLELDKFEKRLKEATKDAFLQITNSPDLYGFALQSDENCQTILAVSNTTSHLKLKQIENDDPECLNCKFSPEEWDFGLIKNQDAFINLTNELGKEDEIPKTEEEFIIFQKNFYSLCFNVLLELRNEDFFNKNYEKEIFLIFEVSEFEFEKNQLQSMVLELNHNHFADEYINWMNTWDS